MRVGDDNVGKLRRGDECARSTTEGLECSSPARVAVSKLLAIVKKCRGGKRNRERERECDHQKSCELRREKIHALKFGDGNGNGGPRNSPEIMADICTDNSVSESGRQEVTFNLAAGLGLLSLIAASKTELDKTVELRREMELYLRSIKEEQQSNGTTPKLSDPRVAYAVSSTVDGLSNVSPLSLVDHAPSPRQPEPGISLVCDKYCNTHEKVLSVGGMDNLEEQLAAEFERLQVDIETEESSEHQVEVNEISSTNTSTQSSSLSSGEVVDPQDAFESEYSGVPPLELERRLHEVLEARQEERIKELEAHLECMKRKLQEKEVEVTWWKDTAKLFSKQVPESSQFLR